MSELSHIDHKGNPTMVGVSDKKITKRTAIAQSIIELPEEVSSHFQDGDIQTKKGAVFQTAIIAGIMGAKRTHELIPMCHPLGIENCNIDIQLNEDKNVIITSEVKVTHKTGVEMEALSACSIAALTVYDMCKALSHHIIIKETKLLKKTGGKSDFSSS